MRRLLVVATAASVFAGVALAYWRPQAPLLAYWLAVATILGVTIALTRSLTGLRERASWLMAMFALLTAVALGTTQLAARRVISPTHLTYAGVHLVGLDAVSVGVGAQADVRLQPVTSAPVPWRLLLKRDSAHWVIEPDAGIEQLRVGPLTGNPRFGAFDVAQSVILGGTGEWSAIVDPTGVVVDRVRLAGDRLESERGNHFLLSPVSGAVVERYRRRLRTGVSLAQLDGVRSAPSPYERFVRVQRLSPDDVVNGAGAAPLRRLFGGAGRLLLSATPPYRLDGAGVRRDPLAIRDSALVEVRSGAAVWRFAVHVTWRREPSAPPGVSILFTRNPAPLDTPLPAGVSCPQSAACGAISLRRLPPPIAHIALDYAGFDPDRFGLLGTVRDVNAGFEVTLPRARYVVERGRPRPVAVPVTDLAIATAGPEGLDDEREAEANGEGDTSPVRAATADVSRWVLLGATGQGDYTWRIASIGIGLALLFAALYFAVRGVSTAVPAPRTLIQERALTLGITAILALLLTRVIVGARVAYLDPFERRAIETAIGLCVAIAVVAGGLLSWSAWAPPLLAGARAALTGQRSLGRVVGGAREGMTRLFSGLRRPGTVRPAGLALLSLLVLAAAGREPLAVRDGLLAGTVVLMVWLCVAWVAAFTGPWFETFERGAWSVVEQLPPDPLLLRNPDPATPRERRGWSDVRHFLVARPELALIIACLAAQFAHMWPTASLLAGGLGLGWMLALVWRRRRGMRPPAAPDYLAATVGVAVFALCIALLRRFSESGSMGAFVLVVLVGLASVRIGRVMGSRLERPAGSAGGATGALLDSLLLAAPMMLLLPLAVIDMGLALVMAVPLGMATLLAVGWRIAGWRVIGPAVAVGLMVLVGGKVVFPSVAAIRAADSHAAQAAAFDRMSTFFGTRVFGTSMDRAAARGVVTRDQDLAEALLVSATPGPARDLLVPSIEQVWGARAYSSAGMWGEGLGRAVVGGRGVAETVSYAENTFSVFVLAEHGAAGGALVLTLYLLLTGAVAIFVLGRPADTPSSRASRSLFLVAGLIVAVPTLYVALSNLGLVPITGQNMPFLGLNAWSDVAICAGVVGILLTGAMRGLEEDPS
jgi:hypothetical protein